MYNGYRPESKSHSLTGYICKADPQALHNGCHPMPCQHPRVTTQTHGTNELTNVHKTKSNEAKVWFRSPFTPSTHETDSANSTAPGTHPHRAWV